jgi:hypothetical protein
VLVYAALSLAGKGRRGALASMGLALVALGGLRLDYAHYSLLAMAGMVLMALALTESSQARCLAAGLIAATRATGKPSVETAVGAGNPNAR